MPTIQLVTEAIDQLFQAHNWKFITDPDSSTLRTAFGMQYDRIPEIRMLLSFSGVDAGKTGPEDECQGLRIIASCNIKAAPEMRAAAAEYITRVNFGLYNGNFELDYSDGEIRYKTYVNCRDQLPALSVLEDAMHTPVFLFRRYGDGLLDVLEGRKAPELAVRASERK